MGKSKENFKGGIGGGNGIPAILKGGMGGMGGMGGKVNFLEKLYGPKGGNPKSGILGILGISKENLNGGKGGGKGIGNEVIIAVFDLKLYKTLVPNFASTFTTKYVVMTYPARLLRILTN